jgi:hypothetical protein
MAETFTLRVQGINELIRAFRKVDQGLRRQTQRELQEIARIVSDDARNRIDARYGGGSGRYIRPRVKGSSAIAESRARSTGRHPNFGGLIMTRGLLPARAAKQDEVVKAFEKMLDKLGSGAGF